MWHFGQYKKVIYCPKWVSNYANVNLHMHIPFYPNYVVIKVSAVVVPKVSSII